MSLKGVIRASRNQDFVMTPKLQVFLMGNPNMHFDDNIADFVKTVMTTEPRDRRASFSASSAGQCHRRQIFQYIGVDSGMTNGYQLQNIFEDGKWRHMRWQSILMQAGLLDRAEVSLDWPAKRSKGSMDGAGYVSDDHPNVAWRGLEFLFELKGANMYSYQDIVKEGPKRYLAQVHRYFLISGAELAVIIVENKNFNEWVEFVIEPDQDMLNEQQAELDALNTYVDDEELPPVLPECQQLKGKTYGACPYGKDSDVCMSLTAWPQRVEVKIEKGS